MPAVGSADIDSLAEALRDTGQQADATTMSVLQNSANYLKSEMEARVPVRTGKLRQSIQIRILNQKVIIGPDTDYANFVEFGTAPHEIKPKNKKALAFRVGGKTVIVKSVHHPGTKAQPFVRPAFDAWVDTLGGLVAEAHVQRLSSNYTKRSAA